jgi:hypothetical protein
MMAWQHGEYKPKGFVVLNYDTDAKSYELRRIANPYADNYNTFIVDTSVYRTREDYSGLMSQINKILKNSKKYDTDIYIRILMYITDEKELNSLAIETLKQEYSSVRNVKLVVENKITKAEKKEKTKKLNRLKESYGFLFNDTSVASKYKEFIKATKNIDIDEDIIEEIIKPCLEVIANGQERNPG